MDVEQDLSRELREVADQLAVPALPALPDEPTRSRRPWQPLLVAAAVALIIAGAVSAVTWGPDTGSGPDPAAPTASSPESMVVFDPLAEVDGAGDTSDLTGLPDDFRAFIGATARRLFEESSDGSACTADATWVNVERFDPSGFAIGGVGACGGAAAIWARDETGTWYEVFATQDLWDCTALQDAAVPAELLGQPARCYAYDGDEQVHDYEQP